jgi:hypothetical protein
MDSQTRIALGGAIDQLNSTAFLLETVAHLRGMEQQLLPLAQQARQLAEQIKEVQSK